jgi:hypothetical protein
MSLEFTQEETKNIEIIAKYYDVVKELLIFGEQIDPESRTLTQPINEIRNCFDHLSRVILYKLGIKHVDEPDGYVKTNLEKSYGHVYRAAYDTLDWVALTLKEIIIDELKGFSVNTISHVLPTYYSQIKPRFEHIINVDIVKLRAEKDVAIKNEDNLVNYGNICVELRQIHQTILDAKPGIVEYEYKTKQQKRIGYILTYLLGGGFTALILWLITQFALK